MLLDIAANQPRIHEDMNNKDGNLVERLAMIKYKLTPHEGAELKGHAKRDEEDLRRDHGAEFDSKGCSRAVADGIQKPSADLHCSTVCDRFEIPELAITISEALVEIVELCHKLKEHEEICRLVYGRLKFVSEELDKISDEQTMRQRRVLFTFGRTIANFFQFLKKQSQKSLIERLASNRKVVTAIQDFNEDIDELYKLLNLVHLQELAKCRREWGEDRRKQEQMLLEIVNQQWIHADMNNKDSALMESLAMLKYEMTHTKEQSSMATLDMMKKTFDKTMRTSGAKVSAVPEWLIRSDVPRPLDSDLMDMAALLFEMCCGRERPTNAAIGSDIADLDNLLGAARCCAKFISRDGVEFDSTAAFDCGCYASIHRGKWTKDAPVVIKRLYVDGAEALDAFFKEFHVWKTLTNPHIIKLFGACPTNLFFVCEDAGFGNFVDYFEEDKSEIWRLFYEAALGLHYLHTRRVVHGDLKCRDLLVGSNYKAKICDFGSSFIKSESDEVTIWAEMANLRWKAPECLVPMEEEASAANNPHFESDVFSFGMCIIEAFSGEPPYGLDDDDDQILERVQSGVKCPRPKGLEDDEWELVKRMTDTEWQQRISLPDAISELQVFADREKERNDAGKTGRRAQADR